MLLADPPRDDEQPHDGHEPHRFGALARRLWVPLLRRRGWWTHRERRLRRLRPAAHGTTVLEASAGTGKTFTIAALATRYVAEGMAELPELMLVTFGRAATQELRERVRERLVSAERGLADPGAARGRRHDDDLLRLLADAPDAEVAQRRRRLTRALADFDAATIATTHGFCQQMLRGLGMAGDLEPDATFVESIDDLVERGGSATSTCAGSAGPTRRSRRSLRARRSQTVRRAVEDRQAELAPTGRAIPSRPRASASASRRPPATRSSGASGSAG